MPNRYVFHLLYLYFLPCYADISIILGEKGAEKSRGVSQMPQFFP